MSRENHTDHPFSNYPTTTSRSLLISPPDSNHEILSPTFNTFTTLLAGNIYNDITSIYKSTITTPISSTSETNSSFPSNSSLLIKTSKSGSESVFDSQLIIPMFTTIFLLSVIGNTLVLVTLVQNKRMRTVTNVYLLNLAVSDLLLGVFCMPFTLVGQVLRQFIFGAAMCKLVPYFQAVSVSVGVWTLVAISLERYFAICRPLKSRRWQTPVHAYKMIVLVWLASLGWCIPVLLMSSLQPLRRPGFKCRESWPTKGSEQAYNLFLDAILLLVPMVFMSLAYSLIMSKLWKGLKREIQHNTSCQQQMFDRSCSSSTVNTLLVKNNNSCLNGTVTPTLLTASYTTLPSGLGSKVNNTTNTGGGHSPMFSVEHLQHQQKKRTRIGRRHRKTETVKMWLIKGMAKVHLSKSNLDSYCEYNKTKSKRTLVKRSESHNQINYLPSENNHTTTTTATNSNNTSNSTANTNINYSQCTADYNTTVDEETHETTYTFTRHAIRSNYMDKSIEAKRKVIRMLFVVVAEFFMCWAPVHIVNTLYLFYPEEVYKALGSTGIALVHLLSYINSCCNPITYCFMNRKFRQAFIAIFNCRSMCCCFFEDNASGQRSNLQRNGVIKAVHNNSESGNESTLYVGRASTIGRSEVLVLEAEDRV